MRLPHSPRSLRFLPGTCAPYSPLLWMALCGGAMACGGGSPQGHGGSGGQAGASATTTTGLHLGSGLTGGGGKCPAAQTCADVGATCGQIGDGCGGVIDCGSSCADGQICGGGGEPNVCGAPVCNTTTCDALGADCGQVADGCGGLLDCGSCTASKTCGGGGVASVCGVGSACTPRTCAQQAVGCGKTGDGCGHTIDCGGCPTGQSCGGGGKPSRCGAPQCTPKSCADLHTDCGAAADGCGGIVQCGGCFLPKTCGGLGSANVCGIPRSCTNLCLQQVSCSDPTVTTTVTGTVYAPNGVDPLVNALVYVPNSAVMPFSSVVSCDNCGADVTGSPLVSAISGVDGSFTLQNVPVGTDIPLVIQVGRWRRQVQLSEVYECQENPAPAELTRLPVDSSEGDIPLMAFSTGSVDALECVMRKIGVSDTEFSGPHGGGRVQLYVGIGDAVTSTTHGPNQHGGARALGDYATEDQLWSSLPTLKQYDMVLFACQGRASARPSGARQNLVDYTTAGGRVYTTHLGYTWLTYTNSPFNATAQWTPNPNATVADQTGFINTSFPKGAALAQWLYDIDPSSPLGEIPLWALRQDLSGVVSPSQAWMSVHDPAAVMHYTFNTPVGHPASQQCGRVLFDDFHVEDADPMDGYLGTEKTTFPDECDDSTMTPQEKLLEFMLFDLSSCITSDTPTCTPWTCNSLGVHCGQAGDGCGKTLNCGSCPTGQTCGGGGIASTCGAPACTPSNCTQQLVECGPTGDGCGNLLQCGDCPAGQTCGGGGKPGVCGNKACVPRSCADLDVHCGPSGDGCGKLLDCGPCPAGQSCGGGGLPGVCGGATCAPKSCADLKKNCGPVADGCGSVVQCGDCPLPQTCGADGVPNVCGGSAPR